MKLKNSFRRRLSVLALSFAVIVTGSYADDVMFVVTSEQWNIPRNERTILQMPPLRDLIHAYQNGTAARILIKYPGGDEGTLWASELRGWLVSLGVASVDIDLVPGARQADTLELHLVTSRQKS